MGRVGQVKEVRIALGRIGVLSGLAAYYPRYSVMFIGGIKTWGSIEAKFGSSVLR